MSGPSTAWAAGISALAHSLGKTPLPLGISEGKVGHWNLRVNNSKETAGGIEPFGLEAKNGEYLAVGLLHPSGGLIGGYSEDQFIKDMMAALPADHPFASEGSAA